MSSESAPDPQTFLSELDKKLWTAADRLRSNLDAAVYKHAVLGLIFLKYVSDFFAQRQAEIEAMIKDPESDFYMPPDSYDTQPEGIPQVVSVARDNMVALPGQLFTNTQIPDSFQKAA